MLGTTTGTRAADRARALEREALARLTEAAGDRSMCAISRDGSPHVAAKYHEGAVSALAAVRRALSRDDTVAAADAVRAASDRWRAQGDRLPGGTAWASYAAGGRDALERLLLAVQGA